MRALGRQIVDEKGFFALHADERSHLIYGLMFWLYSSLCTARSYEAFVHYPKTSPSYASPCYALMIPFSLVAAPYSFTTNGYAEGFLREWWDTWVARGDIVEMAEGYRLTPRPRRPCSGAWQRLLAPKSISQCEVPPNLTACCRFPSPPVCSGMRYVWP